MSDDGVEQQTDQQSGGVPVLEDFRAELDVFSGPLELLLHLVRRDEVDVLEIPIALITEQYLGVLQAMQIFDVNVAAEFLVMAATLMDIKSRCLLPETEREEDEGDPRDELVRQLLQYKRFRQAAEALRELAEVRARKFSRPKTAMPEPEEDETTPEQLLQEVSLWDLLSAYAEVVRETEVSRPARIVYDEVPLSVYMDEVVGELEVGGGGCDLLRLVGPEPGRSRVVGMFLALLELVRQGRVILRQEEGEKAQIAVSLAPAEDRQPGDDEGD